MITGGHGPLTGDHLTHTTAVKLFSSNYPLWYYRLSNISKEKGVASGFRRGTSFTYESAQIYVYGRYIFQKSSLGNLPCTLANIYAPNHDQAGFIASTLTKLKDFTHGCIIFVGDFNSPLEPTIVTSQRTPCLPTDIWHIFAKTSMMHSSWMCGG